MTRDRLPDRIGLWLAAATLTIASCHSPPPTIVQGDADNGRLLLRQFGCGTCHRIPGVAAAKGVVGPPLDGIARRIYLAGRLPNTPESMQRWIRDPQGVDPQTAMPNVGLTEQHARDITAYLYRLR